MSQPGSDVEVPAFMEYPDILQLSDEPNPALVKGYLTWTLDERHPERRISADERLRWLGVGMHFLTVAQKKNDAGQVIDKIELNFWNSEFPAEVGAGGHAHSRDMDLTFYGDPRARQTITHVSLVGPGARDIEGPVPEERLLTILSKVDNGDGNGPKYNPLVIGERLTLESTVRIAPLSRQKFHSLLIHEVAYDGPGTSVTVQRQGAHEIDYLSSFDGLRKFKGLSKEEAKMVEEQRSYILSSLKPEEELVASTVLVRPMDFTPDQMEERSIPTPPERFAYLAEGTIRSLERLMKLQGV